MRRRAISDVNFGGGDADWHTILVGGLGKGGMSYYAIDVSQPNDITSETELAKRVLWQFTDPDLGYTYGRAIVAKTHAFGGQWVVIVPSGYNNVSGAGASGEGKVFFLRASDGKLLTTLDDRIGLDVEPVRPRANRGLRAGLPQPVRRADLRRRPAGQLLALRHLQHRRHQVAGDGTRSRT